MYLDYFGLTEAPFSIAPDPHFLYLSQRHQEALAHLLYGIQGDGGFVLLTGEVGSGKTTICRCLLEQVPENCDVAYVFNPKLTAVELLATICTEIGIDCPPENASIKVFIDRINDHLLEAHANGRHTVLIIDEAQNLSIDVLEQMRLLTNLETNRKKLLQIILIGQPELLDVLARQELRQLSQRIIARFHLDPLSRDEIAAYVSHRIEVSGGKAHLIPESLSGRLYKLTGGVPRLINLVCDRALLGAFAQSKERVDKATLDKAAREVLHPVRRQPTPRPLRPAKARREWTIDWSLLQRPLLNLPRIRIANPFAGVRWHRVGIACASLCMSALIAGWAWQHDWSRAVPTPERTLIATSHRPVPAKPAAAPDIPATPPVLPASAPKGNRALAYAALFQSWGADFDPTKGICAQAEQQGLRCYSGQSDLEDLLSINRPAVLLLNKGKGRTLYATLMALGGDQAKLIMQGKPQTLPVEELNAQWSGDFTLLWRPPAEIPRKVEPGDKSEGVRWVAQRLARWQGTPVSESDVLDRPLVASLKAFQQAHGLRPDGTAGAQTLMRLASLEQNGAPLLSLHAHPARPEARGTLSLRSATELTAPQASR